MESVTTSSEMENLFLKGMHHRQLSVIFLNQIVHVLSRQAFTFTKTNTCPWGKKKLDCIMSLDIQYLKKKKSKKKSTFIQKKERKFQNEIPCIFRLQIEINPNPVMNLRVIGKI